MCGICGIASADPQWVCDPTELAHMCDSIAYRGPDDSGTLQEGGIALGSQRLAILDLSARGHMPMQTPDGRFVIVYNGEIYNIGELRRELEARGHRFRSTTDTEVLLTLFAERGPAVLQRLNGMFAFAVWDRRERTLWLVRDRLGIKPLYYSLQRETIRFASEPKALVSSLDQGVAFDPTVWEELLCFRFVAGRQTVYEGIRRVLPGHYMVWHGGKVEETRWWNLGERVEALRATGEAARPEWLRERFDDSVSLRRISDVPVGVLLSGGLDSSSVAISLAMQAGKGVECFTVGFDDPAYDETALAQVIAQSWRMRAHTLRLDAADIIPRLEQASRLNDEPLAHGNEPHLLAISELAKAHVTVLLSGEGADEVFGGYVRYRPLRHPGLARLARPFAEGVALWSGAPPRVRKLGRLFGLGSPDAAVLYNACDVLPADLALLGMRPVGRFAYREAMLTEARDVYPGDLGRQAMYADQHTFLCSLLDRNDKMTMGASIECRVPFLDFRIVEQAAAFPSRTLLPDSRGKPLIRNALGPRLPAALLRHRKWGFGVPWSRYLRTIPALRETVLDLFRAEPVRDGPFDTKAISALSLRFLAGDDRNATLVRQLVMIVFWYRACVRATHSREVATRRLA
jgi:asparagine synthase (glutamine-hydrolysing)